jgi:hypothetical protein
MTSSPPDSITLPTYIQILASASRNGVQRPEAGTVDRPVLELLRSGLLSEAPAELAGFSVSRPIVITPEGAAALVEWSDYMHRRSWRGRLETLGFQMLLVFAGAFATQIPQLFG